MGITAEIGIVGAGPAGARAAERLAGLGADVVMFDPRAPWEKPCGGGLTAAALETIPELANVIGMATCVTSVRLESNRAAIEVPLDQPLHVLSRKVLSRWQLDRALVAGASLEPVAVQSVVRSPDGEWRIDLERGDQARVRMLVGADGAASRVRKAVAPDLDIELAPGRIAFVPGAGRTPAEIGLRFFRDVNGYAWDFPRPDHRSIGVGVEPGSWARQRMDGEVDRYRADVDNCVCPSVERAGAVIGTAANPLGWRYSLLGQRDYALLGDAAGFADPATGEGIQNAIRSADFLALAFERDRTFAAYAQIARRHLEHEFAVARLVRRILYGGNVASGLIEQAIHHRWAYALLASVVNGGNAHDPSLLRRFAAEWRRASRKSDRRHGDRGPRHTAQAWTDSVEPTCAGPMCLPAAACECRVV